ncbi:hypothetical protein CPB83DRAFT_515149 [Crepidotus variabilis]|uniref:Uncharacterized protein n=1 Tax=Crepidotus variabilis TaxID=179855 RepID=A0A9P6EAC4_9AGAR|nr:hypothetical protein CPB83DRAFT_515149 [Crepidotus variabilis]
MKRPRLAILDLCNPVSYPLTPSPMPSSSSSCMSIAALCHSENFASSRNLHQYQTQTHRQAHYLTPNSSEPLAAPLQQVDANEEPPPRKRRKTNSGTSLMEVPAEFNDRQEPHLHNDATASSNKGSWTSSCWEPPSPSIVSDRGSQMPLRQEPAPKEKAKTFFFKPIMVLDRETEEVSYESAKFVNMAEYHKSQERKKAGGRLPGDNVFNNTIVEGTVEARSKSYKIKWM